MQLRPYDTKVVFALILKIREYTAANVAAIYAQGSITFDPSQPLQSLWTASDIELYGSGLGGFEVAAQLQRTVTNSVDVTFTATGTPGSTVAIDVIVYDPTGNPI